MILGRGVVLTYRRGKGWIQRRVPVGVADVWELNDHLTRYQLAEPFESYFVDREALVGYRAGYARDLPYTAFLSGGDPSGGALRVGESRRLMDAVALAQKHASGRRQGGRR